MMDSDNPTAPDAAGPAPSGKPDLPNFPLTPDEERQGFSSLPHVVMGMLDNWLDDFTDDTPPEVWQRIEFAERVVRRVDAASRAAERARLAGEADALREQMAQDEEYHQREMAELHGALEGRLAASEAAREALTPLARLGLMTLDAMRHDLYTYPNPALVRRAACENGAAMSLPDTSTLVDTPTTVAARALLARPATEAQASDRSWYPQRKESPDV